MLDFTIKFIPSGRGAAQCPPNPEFPKGVMIDAAGEKTACAVTLPYPAPECGMFMLECRICGMKVAVTAAGRPDDPMIVRVPCKVPT